MRVVLSPAMRPLPRRALAEVEAQRRLRPRRAAVAQRVIDDGVFEPALDILLRLENRDRLDPVEHRTRAVARVAVGAQPFVHIDRTGLIGRYRERIAAAVS